MSSTYVFDRERLTACVERLKGQKVLIVGDVMIDEYFIGDAERISPEAPVPVVKVQERRLLVGGAGNVARNISTLGGQAELIGVHGTDVQGKILLQTLQQQGIRARLSALEDRPTTVKTRILARNQQMLRVDHEANGPLSAKATVSLLAQVQAIIENYSVLVVSDYGKGVVTKELMDGLRSLCERPLSNVRILVDPKTPNIELYAHAHILTPNTKETSEAANLPANTSEEILRAGEKLLGKLQCAHLLTTLGPQGMALFLSKDEVWHIPAVARQVFDVTGAGDTVMAVLSLGLAAGLELLDACLLANYAAGLVVGVVGAGSTTIAELLSLLQATEKPAISRWR